MSNTKQLNDTPLKVLRDLGMEYPKASSKKRAHYAMFECPTCHKGFKATVNNVKRGRQKCCSSKCSQDLYTFKGELTQKILKDILHYDKDTGVFTRLAKLSLRHTIGETVGVKTKKGEYLKTGINNKEYLLHRLAYLYMTGNWPTEIDHIDHNGLNNAWHNLRDVDGFINHQNMSRSSRNTSGITGVSFKKATNKWVAQIHTRGKALSKSFTTKFGAIRQRVKWNREFNFHANHGKKVNKPPKDDTYYSQSIGVYYTQVFKTKPNKTFLLSMNKWNTAHYHLRNDIKQFYNDAFVSTITKANLPKITGKYETAYVYYYKNSQSDLSNVCSLVSKAFLDAAQQANLVSEDNVKFCMKEAFYVGEQDKENPRVEVYIRKWKEDT